MKIEIRKYEPMDRLTTDLIIKVDGFLTYSDLLKQKDSRDSVLTLLERKAKELARAIETEGPSAFMGWQK